MIRAVFRTPIFKMSSQLYNSTKGESLRSTPRLINTLFPVQELFHVCKVLNWDIERDLILTTIESEAFYLRDGTWVLIQADGDEEEDPEYKEYKKRCFSPSKEVENALEKKYQAYEPQYNEGKFVGARKVE